MERAVIYENLAESVFTYNTDKHIFYFSSLFYMNKFSDEIEDFRKKINNKFKSLYLMPVDLNDYADLVYYNKVEKRGFMVRVRESNEVINWLGNITLSGVIKTNKS